MTRAAFDQDVPMTRAAFEEFGKTQGLSADEREDYWKELYEDPSVDRDQGGWRGKERLWVPNAIVARQRERRAGIRDTTVEESKPIKDPKEHDVQVLKDHVANQTYSMADKWLKRADESEGFTQRKRGAVVKLEKDASEASAAAAKKAKRYGPGDAPKLHKSMGKVQDRSLRPEIQQLLA